MRLDDGESHRFLFFELSVSDWWHLECGVDPSVVVVADLLVNSLDQFSDMTETSEVTKLELEVVVERFLVAILPGTRLATVGDLGTEALKEGLICS
jgi:hypothetical protein